MQKAYDQALDIDQIQTLRITKNYPGEAAWSLEVERTGPGIPGSWKVRSAPISLQDSIADAPFIHHLLDTVKTYRPALEAPEGPKSSQGFEPPRAVLEWSEIREGKKFERKLVLGEGYGLNGRFTIFAPGTRAVIAGGALLEMLEHAIDWQTLRMKRFVTWDIDDVDIVRVANTPFERVGTHWEKEKRDVTESFLPALESLMHQRILRFIDDKTHSDAIELKTADQRPFLQLELEDRKKKTQRLTFYRFNESIAEGVPTGDKAPIYAKNSDRIGWVELYPDSMRTLSAFTQAISTPVKSGTKK